MAEFICDNISSKDGQLYFAGQRVKTLADKYGTPLYLMDEDKIREKCRLFNEAVSKYFPQGSGVMYASKACCFKNMYRIIEEEGLAADVVSSGEIYTAISAGFDASKLYFQGNNKTDEDIAYAMSVGVGCFVADNIEEIKSINIFAEKFGIRQKILLRLTPGIDTHTYEADQTGKIDSKFGVPIETGQALELIKFVLGQEHIDLTGFQCHIGSQVFEEDVFERSVEVMIGFAAEVKEKLGYTLEYLDLGGGYGVRYVDTDPYLHIEEKIESVGNAIKKSCKRHNIEAPKVLLEPGRCIVADAGMTVYSVGTIKTIPGYKNYISIDGGMTDNPRYALYGAKYTCLPADRMDDDRNTVYDLVGRCCESGDIIQPEVKFPEDMKRGDLVAVCTTGAYNYSMASNYNRIGRPPVVMLTVGENYLAVRRETLEDMCMYDV